MSMRVKRARAEILAAIDQAEDPVHQSLRSIAQRLTELKVKDLADVQELIRVLKISREFEDRLNPYVREKSVELWRTIQQVPPEE